MIERIVDLSESPAYLCVRNSCLVIEQNGGAELHSAKEAADCKSTPPSETSMPLGEAAVVVLAHPQLLLTQPVLAGLAEAGGIVVICDSKRMPNAMLLPLAAHFTQGERFVRQAQVSAPTRKRLWQSIVKAKIKAQARVLLEIREDDAGLIALVDKVRSGDAGNVEAEASRRYWPLLFADPSFRRSRYGGRQNHLLNYGYAVLRAIVARSVCAAGLHPSLGLHHHNRYDAFRLVDDLMEPFRPIVDRAVSFYCEAYGSNAPVDKQAKTALIGALMGKFTVNKHSRSLFDIANRTAASLVDIFAGKRRELILPEL